MDLETLEVGLPGRDRAAQDKVTEVLKGVIQRAKFVDVYVLCNEESDEKFYSTFFNILQGVNHLQTLSVKCTGVTSSKLALALAKFLRGRDTTRKFKVRNNDITITHAGPWNVKLINVANASDVLRAVYGLRVVRSLHVEDVELDSEGFKALWSNLFRAKSITLDKVDCFGCDPFESMQAALTNMPSLPRTVELVFSRCGPLFMQNEDSGDVVLGAALRDLHTLTILELQACTLSNFKLEEALRGLHKLEYLGLSQNEYITNVAVEYITKVHPREIDIRGTGITRTGVMEIIKDPRASFVHVPDGLRVFSEKQVRTIKGLLESRPLLTFEGNTQLVALANEVHSHEHMSKIIMDMLDMSIV